MKILRNLLLTILLLGSLLVAGNFSYAKDYEYKSLDIHADVKIDGTIDIRETFTANFLERKHGIIRNIPLNYKVDGYKFHINVDSILVDSHNYSVISNGDNIDIKIGNADKTVIGIQTYPISYSVYGLIRNFSGMGYSELYWNLVGYDFDTNVDSIKAEITLPKKNSFSSDDFLITVDGNENSVGSFAGKVDWNQGDKIIITYDKKLSAGEGITFAVKFPSDYFVFDHDKQGNLIGFVGEKSGLSNMFTGGDGSFSKIIAMIIGVIIVAYFMFKSLFTGISEIFTHHNGSYIHKSEIEDELYKESPIVVRYGPPKGVNCAEAGMLYNCILEPTDLTSLLYKWVDEGLISLRIEESVNFEKIDGFVITKLKNIDGSYPSYEVKFFNYLLPGEINSRKSISKSSALEVSDSLKSLRNYGRSKGWITVGLFSDNTKYFGIFCGVLIFIILLLVGIGLEFAIYLGFLVIAIFDKKSDFPIQKRISLTDEGKRLALEVIGYAKFIQACDENKLRLFLKQDPSFFDKTLPYAVAFGFETSFIKKITPLLKELDVKSSLYNGDLYEMNYVNSIINTAIREHELRKQKERDRERSTYERSGGFSSGSSFNFGGGGFSRGGGGGGGGSRSW